MDFEILETSRLLLRKMTPDNFRYVFEHFQEPEIRAFLGLRTEEAWLKEKNKYEHGYTTYNRSFMYFQLIDKESGIVIGNCVFHNWYVDHKRAELGYAITEESFKEKGLMSEALGRIIDYGFNDMNLHRIEALIAPDNVPSLKLVAKYGFTQEGILREHYYINNRFEDSVFFSKLKSDPED